MLRKPERPRVEGSLLDQLRRLFGLKTRGSRFLGADDERARIGWDVHRGIMTSLTRAETRSARRSGGPASRGELVSADLPIVVREISLGGMSIETREAFEAGAHDFVLTLGDGAGVLVLGRVAYSRSSVAQADLHHRHSVL